MTPPRDVGVESFICLFKRDTGLTPYRHLQRHRRSLAARLLVAGTAYPVKGQPIAGRGLEEQATKKDRFLVRLEGARSRTRWRTAPTPRGTCWRRELSPGAGDHDDAGGTGRFAAGRLGDFANMEIGPVSARIATILDPNAPARGGN